MTTESSPDPATAALRVHPVPFYLPFRGSVTRVRPGVLLLRATAPASVLRTTFGDDALRGDVDVAAGAEAHLEARITLLGDGSLQETGTVGFGGGTAMRFRSSGEGRLRPVDVDPALEQGAVCCVVDAGSGWLDGVSGSLVSSFLVSRTGELTDHQLGLVFLPVAPGGRDGELHVDVRTEPSVVPAHPADRTG